jgi:putative transposase
MARVRTIPRPPPRPQGPAVRVHFGPNDRITIDEVDYRCIESNDDGHIFRSAADKKIHKAISHDDLPAVMGKRGNRHDREAYALGEVKARLHAGVPFLSHVPKKEHEKILWKYDFVTEFLRLEKTDPSITRGDDSMDEAIGRVDAILKLRVHLVADHGRRRRAGRAKVTFDPPNRKRFLEWVKMLTEGNFNPISLRDKYEKCGNRTPRLQPEGYDLLEEFADKFLSRTKPKIRSLHMDMQIAVAKRNPERIEKGLPALIVPSYDRLREEVAKLPEFEVVACREGIEVAMKRFRPVGEGIQDVYRPFQHTEMDHWSVQLQTWCVKSGVWDQMTDWQKAAVDKARYTLGMVACRRTRCIAGLRLTETATAQSAVELLEMAVSDKHDYAVGAGAATPWDIHGTMGWMYADGGFANYEFKTALGSLSIGFEIPPNGLAHMRALIERSFRLMHQGVVARFEGRTFENIIRKGDYDSEARASIFVDELAAAFVRYAVDVHHNTPHPSLDYETPRECWLRLTKELGVDPSPDWHKRRHIFGVDIKRTLGPAGLRFLGIQYRSEKLHDHFIQHGIIDMAVRVHERNLGAISARIGKHWLTVYGPSEFEHLPADIWIAAEADLRRRGYRTADVTAPIRLKAIDDMNRLAADGSKRFGIDDDRMTSDQLLAAERRMQIGANFPDGRDRPDDTGGDLYDGALTVGQPAPAAAPAEPTPAPPAPAGAPETSSPPNPPRRNDKRRWVFPKD